MRAHTTHAIAFYTLVEARAFVRGVHFAHDSALACWEPTLDDDGLWRVLIEDQDRHEPHDERPDGACVMRAIGVAYDHELTEEQTEELRGLPGVDLLCDEGKLCVELSHMPSYQGTLSPEVRAFLERARERGADLLLLD